MLLEQYAIALVPHAPFLLDRLTAPARSRDEAGVVLALGGVAYGQAPKPVDDEKTKLELLAVRQAETQRGRGDGWTELPGTREELETVVHLAETRGVVRLEGTAASTAGLLRALPQARWAHIATHGFFADPTRPLGVAAGSQALRSVRTLSGRTGLRETRWSSRGWSWPGPIDHPPMSMGRPTTTWESSPPRRSPACPCRTWSWSCCRPARPVWGWWPAAKGSLVSSGLFTWPGRDTVVASLWKVDDTATRKLMMQFYSNLWQQGMPAAEALRQAQLTVLNEAVGSGDKPYYWAGWVLSGDPGIR